MYTFISFVLALILSSSLANAQCSASVSAQPRQGSSWTSNGVTYQLYDISAINTGSAPITSLYAFFGYPSGTAVSSSWNYDPSNGEITGFGSALNPQAAVSSAGFTLAGSGTPSLAYVTPICGGQATYAPTAAPTDAPTQQNCYNQCSPSQVCVALTSAGPKCNPRNCADAQCGDNQVCIDDGGVARCITESTPAPTETPATAASVSTPADAPTQSNCFNQCSEDEICIALHENAAPACTPRTCDALQCQANQVCIDDGGVARCITTGTNAPTAPASAAASDSCSVTVQANPRPSYTENGVVNTIWDLVFTSNGASTVTALNVVISVGAGTTVTQQWNMSPLGYGSIYSVSSYDSLNKNGATYTSAGFVTAGPGINSVSISTVTCA